MNEHERLLILKEKFTNDLTALNKQLIEILLSAEKKQELSEDIEILRQQMRLKIEAVSKQLSELVKLL